MLTLSRLMFISLVGVALLVLGPQPLRAYPDRVVRIVVPYNAGGGTDTLARTLAGKLEQIWKKPVIVENKGGGNTVRATEYVSRLEPDGYNILLVTTIFSVNPALVGKLPYDTLTDFTPVVLAGTAPCVLVARPTLPINSVSELIDYAHAHPGKLSYGTPEIGTAPWLAAELLRLNGKIDAVDISYRGTQQQLLALLSGDIDYAFDLVSSLEYVKTGRLKALAVTESKRLDKIPEIPTMIEAGFPDYEAATWYGFVVGAGTPPDIVHQINQAFNQAIDDPAVRGQMSTLGIRLVGGTSEQFLDRIRADMKKWAMVLGQAALERRETK
jgi:tripartite-type tricarboxylate transporter receptor subunit TctC